jgi:hypothetical protein
MNILLVGKCVVLLEAFADSTEFFVALQDKKMQALRKGDDPLSQTDLGRKTENAPVNKEALRGHDRCSKYSTI